MSRDVITTRHHITRRAAAPSADQTEAGNYQDPSQLHSQSQYSAQKEETSQRAGPGLEGGEEA